MNQASEKSESSVSKWIYIRWFLLRFALVVYDIVAVNASVLLALVTRFYVANQFHSVSGHYFIAYAKYAPVYTLFCVLVFAGFRLYSGIWKYAGLNDLSRILSAGLVAFAGHVVGTLIFGIRMPITIYCISGVILLALIGIVRFSYRLLLSEKDRLTSQGKTQVNALLVGVGGTARSVVKQMQQDTMVRPVCMLDYQESGYGAMMDGIFVVRGIENLKTAIDRHHVNLVVLASTVIPKQMRNEIREVCEKANVEVQDYSGFFQNSAVDLTLRNLAECSVGPVELVVNGSSRHYADCEQALMDTEGKYIVKSISAKNNTLVVELADHHVVLNDLNDQWVKDQENETGEEISFF